ncbi:MAG: S-layer homology domain-containing protein, partial [Oscillospiraceae bacterium]|nr:S-layer homology domain-containing protein [Oscillospiraceae bacterium]
AMFAQVLANIERVDLSVYTTSRFTDVSVGAWFTPAVEWAAAMGIVNGYGGGRFGPEDNITREQMAVMLMNYVNYKGYELPTRVTTDFNDETSIALWAYDAVKRVQAAGIVSGKPGNIYDPQGLATRAEVATIFTNYINAYVNYAIDFENEPENTNPPTGATQTAAMTAEAYIDRRALEELERALLAGQDGENKLV